MPLFQSAIGNRQSARVGWNCRFSIAEFWLKAEASSVCGPLLKPEVAMPLFQSAIGNRQSAISNRQSTIGNRQSAIGN
jgi:hypothetical protein